MTAVIYARYSSDNQREESIEGQIRECTAYAEKNGITIVKHYIDRAISAKTDNRPEFQQMIKDSDKKLFDIVLVWKLDRFARNRYDSARYKTQLKKNGVKLMSATEIISEGPEGIILESVLEGYAEYYSADLSEKVIRGMTENALKGKFSGGAIPFGYTINADRRFEIDPLTAPFVAEAFQRYNDGQTMREIRDWLNEKGIKNKRGGPMTFNVIQHMLSNRRYIGELKYRDILIPDAIPPIVSVELFNDVQEKMLKNKKAPARRKAEDDYLLTTKLFCGHCGALMFGESGTSRTGEVHRYYKCATAKKHKGCKKKTVRKQWLEDLVVNQTMQLVRDDAAMESIIAKVMELQNKENTNIPLYEKQLRDAESGIQNMLNAIQAGILTSSTKERLEQLEEAKRELEARIAEEKLAKPKVTEEFIRFWLLRFRKLDMSLKDQRQALVDTFINAIYLYDDKVLITFNYKEGTQTISFEKVEESKAKGNGSDFDCVTAPSKQSGLFSGSGLLYFCCKSYLCVLRENTDDGIGRGYLAGKIQMGINIAGGADIAVPQPLLNFLQAHAVGVKQACAAMAQVVEADALHIVRREELREMLAQKVGADAPAHRVDIDIIEIIRAVILAADLPVQRLLFLHLFEHLLTGRDQRKSAAAGFRFGSIPRDIGHNAVNLCGNDCVLDADGLVLKINGIPFQTNDLAAAQPVECSHDNAELCRVALDRREELFQFLCLVDLRLELFLARTFNAVCGVGTDHADLKSVLQAFADVGVIVDDRVCRNAAIQLMLIEILNVLGVLLKVLQGVVERLKIRDDPARDHDLVVCIGRNCHAGLHHFQPVHEKIVEKYRGVIKAGVDRLDGVRFQPVTVNGILKGIGQLPVPIQKLLYGRFLLLTLIAEKRFQIARSERF